MDISLDTIELEVGDQSIRGTTLSPTPELPGVLFVHGWGGSQERDLGRAREAAGLGCVCLTFDLRGHEHTAHCRESVSRPQNLDDLLAAYDWLAGQPNVDPSSMAVVGISYGGYLACLLADQRPVRWLALRSPAIYKDAGWDLPKRQLHVDTDLPAYRRGPIGAQDNRALSACARFTGDVLIVEAEHDEVVPHAVIENYAAAFTSSRSLTRRVVGGASHAFSLKESQAAYTRLLIGWLCEMVMGARQEVVQSRLEQRKTR